MEALILEALMLFARHFTEFKYKIKDKEKSIYKNAYMFDQREISTIIYLSI